jgi:hypothetical protein
MLRDKLLFYKRKVNVKDKLLFYKKEVDVKRQAVIL